MAVEELVPDTSRPIDSADIERAKQVLIERKDTHLDSLTKRLREPRIRAILEPMLAGHVLKDVPEDDLRSAQDHGLARMSGPAPGRQALSLPPRTLRPTLRPS